MLKFPPSNKIEQVSVITQYKYVIFYVNNFLGEAKQPYLQSCQLLLLQQEVMVWMEKFLT